jgi:hypothetical protein
VQTTASFNSPEFQDTLPACSFTVYSTYHLTPESPGMRVDE